MKTKLVLWGTNAQDERTLIALELRSDDNMVNIYTFPDESVNEDFNQRMMQDWREGVPVEFPEGHSKIERVLTVSEDLLPEDLKVERGDLVQRAQTEWHFIVLSSKLYANYLQELETIKDKVEKLESFDSNIWNELKQFWDKVQAQVRERNLFREHADSLRDNTNALFSQLKVLRAKLDEEFKTISKKNQDSFMEKLGDIEGRIKDGMRLQQIFDELKALQRKFREAKLTRDHRSKVWQRLDAAFKKVKEKRFGAKGDDRSPLERIQRRYDGLIAAIQKMERSINRDRDDLNFQNEKIATTDGQLEAQIRQAKILMIEERIRSKQEKLSEMLQTRKDLEKRIEIQKDRELKRKEREKLEEAKKAAEQKIAEEIKQAAAARKSESEKLEKAAEAIVPRKTVATDEDKETESPAEPALEKDTPIKEEAHRIINEVAEEVGGKIQGAIAELQDNDAAGHSAQISETAATENESNESGDRKTQDGNDTDSTGNEVELKDEEE